MRSSWSGLFLILWIVSTARSQVSQYEILEDNPYKNMFSVDVGVRARLGTGDETLIEFTPKAMIQISELVLTGAYRNALVSLSRTSYEFVGTWFFLNGDETKIEDFDLRKRLLGATERTATYEIQYYRVPMTVRKAKGFRLGFSNIHHLATTEESTFLVNGDVEISRNQIVTPAGKYKYRDAVAIQETQTLSKVAILGYCSETSAWIRINSKNYGEVITDSKSGLFADILYAFDYTFDDLKVHDNFLHIISEDLGPHGEGSIISEPARIDAEYNVKKVFRNFNPWGIRLGLYQTTNTFRKEAVHNIRSHFTTTFGVEIGIQPGPSPIRYYCDLKFSLGFSLF